MQSRQAQVVVLRSNRSPQDKKLSEGFSPRLEWLTQQGIVVWDSACITPGLNVFEETILAVLSSQVVLLLVSIDMLLDPLMKQIEPILLVRAQEGELRLIPILLRPCQYSSSPFAHISLVNNKPIGSITSAVKREKVWEHVCSLVCDALGIQCFPPDLHSLMTDQYLRNLYATFTEITNLPVSLFTASGSGTLTHGLMRKPDRVLLTAGYAQEIDYSQVGSSQLHVSSAGPFTGLVIAWGRS